MNLIGLSLVSGLLALDTTAILQSLVSQPLVACTILGWLADSPELGLKIGFLLQLLWLGDLPVGAAKIPEGNVGSMVGALIAFNLLEFQYSHPHLLIFLVVLYALLFSYIGTKSIRIIRNWNIRLFDKALAAAASGEASVLAKINITALFIHFALMSLVIYLAAVTGEALFSVILRMIPPAWDYYARFTEAVVLGGGVALTITLFRGRKIRLIVLIAALFGGLLFLAAG